MVVTDPPAPPACTGETEGELREKLAAYFLSAPPLDRQDDEQKRRHKAALRRLLRLENRSILQAAGLPDGHYKLGVNDVVVEDGDAKLASNGVRAGSTLTTGQALKNLVKFTGESVERVLPLLTANPARLVGLSYRKGSIAPGKDADLVVLDEELNVRETYVAGRLVYAGECE